MASSIIGKENDPRRAAFSKLLFLVAEAAKDIEWVDSCDSAKGSEHEAIDRCFAFLKADPSTIAKARSYDDLVGKLKAWIEVENE